MNFNFDGLKKIKYIPVNNGNIIVDTHLETDVRTMTGEGKWVYSIEGLLHYAYKQGWNRKKGIDAFVECYAEIILSYIKLMVNRKKF